MQYGLLPCIVCRQRKRDVVRELHDQVVQIVCSCAKVDRGIQQLLFGAALRIADHSVARRGFGQQLHQAERAFGRHSRRIESRLDGDNGLDQGRIERLQAGISLDQRQQALEVRDD